MSPTVRWIIALAVVLLLANLLTVGLKTRSTEEGSADWSTYRYGAQGAAAPYGTLKRLGVDVRRLRDSSTRIPEDCAQLWMLYPTSPLAYDDLSALRNWVFEGGQLVVSYDFLVYTSIFAAQLMRQGEGEIGGPFPELAQVAPPMPSAFTSGLTGGIVNLEPGAYGTPLRREGVFEGVNLLYSPTGQGLSLESAEEWLPLATAQGSTLVAGRRLGSGHIVFLGDPDMLSNRNITRADNMLLVYNLASLAGGPVYFDEHHHGFTERPASVIGLVRRSRGAIGAHMAAVGALCVILAVCWRFGRPVDPRPRPRREASEYVESLARLYQRAGAREAALKALYDAARRRLAGSARRPVALEDEQLARLGAARVGMAPDEVVRVLSAARQALETGCPADSQLLVLGRELARLSGLAGRARPKR